jgi:hypothetical protein
MGKRVHYWSSSSFTACGLMVAPDSMGLGFYVTLAHLSVIVARVTCKRCLATRPGDPE